jgi:hypothetical protein
MTNTLFEELGIDELQRLALDVQISQNPDILNNAASPNISLRKNTDEFYNVRQADWCH